MSKVAVRRKNAGVMGGDGLLVAPCGAFTLLIVLLCLSQTVAVQGATWFALGGAQGTIQDGSLQKPFSKIQDAIAALSPSRLDTIVLLPSVFSGPGNSALVVVGSATILGSNASTTVIDCGGTSFGFYLDTGTFTLAGVTVRNCGNGTTGGAYVHSADLYLGDTRWETNNAGEFGGAITQQGGALICQGANVFANNSALIAGGAIWSNFSAIILDEQETFLGNNIAGDQAASSANIFCQAGDCLIQYPSGSSGPPHSRLGRQSCIL